MSSERFKKILSYVKSRIMLLPIVAGAIVLSCTSAIFCSFGFANDYELAANAVSFAKKNEYGYVELDIAQNENSHYEFLTINREHISGISRFANNDSMFVTYSTHDTITSPFVGTIGEAVEAQATPLGITTYKLEYLPYKMVEDESKIDDKFVCKNNFVANIASFRPEGQTIVDEETDTEETILGCAISKSLANQLVSGTNHSYLDLVGETVYSKIVDKYFKIITIVEDKCFCNEQCDDIELSFIATCYTHYSSKIDDCVFRMFLSNDYYTNCGIFIYLFKYLVLGRTTWFITVQSPQDPFFSGEIDMIFKGDVAKLQALPICFCAVFAGLGFLLLVIIKINKMKISKKEEFFLWLFGIFIYLSLTILISTMINGITISNLHALTTSSFSIFFLLGYIVFFVIGYLVSTFVFNKNDDNDENNLKFHLKKKKKSDFADDEIYKLEI